MARLITRRMAPLLALATAAATALALAPAAAQTEDQAPPTTVAAQDTKVPTMAALNRGETFTTSVWEVSVDNTFSAPSPVRHGYTEVRVGLTMRNVGPEDAIYRSDGFFSDRTYPTLSITDGSGTERALLGSQSTRALLPGSMLSSVPPGMTARWTVGFQVPTAFVDDLSLNVTGSDGAAAFDLSSPSADPIAGPPEGVPTIALGDEFDWGDEFSVRAFDHGALMCGDPTRELAMQIVAVGFEVGNKTALDADWPGIRYPENVAVAQWNDGGSARFVFETFAGDLDPLMKWSEDATRFPADGDGAAAAATYKRAMLFAVPRDGRLVNTAAGPTGLWLRPPGADALWLDLSDEGTLAMSPSLCDEGNFDFAIPFSFGPGAEFLVNAVGTDVDPAAQDEVAREILSEALVIAGNFRAANDDTFEGLTAGALAALWNRVTFNAGFVAEVNEVGVSIAVNAEGDTIAILLTESASGEFFCITAGPAGVAQIQESTLTDITDACIPEAPAPEGGTGGDV